MFLVWYNELVEVDEHEVVEAVHVPVQAVVQGSEQALGPSHRYLQNTPAEINAYNNLYNRVGRTRSKLS